MSESERLKNVIAEIEQSIARKRRRIAAMQAIDFAQQSTDEIIAIVSDPETFGGDTLDVYMMGDTRQWMIEDPQAAYSGRVYATFRDALIACVRGEIENAKDLLAEDIRELRDLGVDIDS